VLFWSLKYATVKHRSASLFFSVLREN